MNNDLISRGDLVESDLISKSALLETMERRSDQMHRRCVTDIYILGRLAGFEDAIKVVEATLAVDAEPVRQWISVKDRLPEDLEEVLILVKETEFYGQYKEFSKSYFCQYIGCVDDGEWFTVWCHGHRYIKDTAAEPYSDKLEVTHWMTLPELPQDIVKTGE